MILSNLVLLPLTAYLFPQSLWSHGNQRLGGTQLLEPSMWLWSQEAGVRKLEVWV